MPTRTIAYDHQIFSLQQYGGISRYFCEVAERIADTAGWQARIVAPVHFNDHLQASNAPRIGRHIRMPIPRVGRAYRAANAVLGPAILASVAPAIVHRTYYSRRPEASRGQRLVVTVFDMIHELFPLHFPPDDRTSAFKRRAVAAADHVICISHSTAMDVEQLLDVPRSKMTVTHLGFSSNFAVPSTPLTRAGKRPYLLYVGHRGGYKNFALLLDAYAASPSLRNDLDLVAFGGHPWQADELARIEALGLRPGSVRRLAGSDADLARCYAEAFAFVYPSTYEGFGIPPLEAMSCGCPVVCSRTSSIPEVVGDAVEYFDPANIEDMRSALERVVEQPGRRQALIEAGHLQHRRFSWDRCAEETLAVYERLLAS
jgi:glycosyltransferase involved in cell wall biosynthesis